MMQESLALWSEGPSQGLQSFRKPFWLGPWYSSSLGWSCLNSLDWSCSSYMGWSCLSNMGRFFSNYVG